MYRVQTTRRWAHPLEDNLAESGALGFFLNPTLMESEEQIPSAGP